MNFHRIFIRVVTVAGFIFSLGLIYIASFFEPFNFIMAGYLAIIIPTAVGLFFFLKIGRLGYIILLLYILSLELDIWFLNLRSGGLSLSKHLELTFVNIYYGPFEFIVFVVLVLFGVYLWSKPASRL